MSARGWTGDAMGGVAAAMIAIPQAMSLGLLAFAALGPSYAAAGVVGALLASVLGNLVAGALPAARCQIMGARSSATVVFAGIVAALAAHPLLHSAQGVEAARVVTLAFAALFLAGLLQIIFALTGLGRAVRFVPHPVAAGFMNGIALIILLSQVGPALGSDAGRPVLDTLRDPASIRPAALAVTAAVLAGIFLARRYMRKIPEAVCGLLVGVVLHYLAAWLFPGSTGAVLGPLPAVGFEPAQLGAMLGFPWREDLGTWLTLLLPSALLLAAVMSLDGLLASVVGDAVTQSQHDGKRLLGGQGAAALLGAAFGALPAVANTHTRMANFMGGGRTPASALFHAGFMLLAIVALGPLVSAMPIAALAGLMIYIALSLMDRWTGDLVRRLRTQGEHRGEIALNLAIVAAVAIALPLLNMMVAFALGVSATIVMLLAKLSGSPVRRVVDGTVRTSLKVRDPHARAILLPLARQIRILELEGQIFFGTAEGLRSQVEALPAGTRYVVLDFRRVQQIDASGARVLQLVGDQAGRRGMQVLLSHVQEDEPRGRYLAALGMTAAVRPEHWFRDLDRALEWAEDQLLQTARFQDAPEVSLAQVALFDGLDASELEIVAAVLERRELGHGEVVFQEGDEGGQLYLIARGFVSIKVKLQDDARAVRLATFSPGVFFGEIAMLEGHKRSSDAFAKGERVVLYALSASRLAELVRRHPQLGLKIYQNLGRELASRVRTTSQALRALE